MVELPKVVGALNTPDLKGVLKQEIESLDGSKLPLQEGLSYSSYANNDSVSAVVMNISDEGETVVAKAGLFYKGIIAGCNCSDDPTPPDEQNEYCEIELVIDKRTAETKISLLDD